jgi:hypothetical protein
MSKGTKKQSPEVVANNAHFQKYYDFLATPEINGERIIQHAVQRSSISDEIAREKKLKNDDTEQDIHLKKSTLNRLFALLVGETIIVFFFTFLQATHDFHFALDEWSFKLLTSVTIAQITVMLSVAVNYLFPKK